MPIGRRTFLRDGTRLAAALLAAPLVWRTQSCNPASIRRGVSARALPGSMCAGRSGGPVRALAPAPAPVIRTPLHPDKLASFVDPLPLPRVLVSKEQRPDPTDPTRQLPYYRVPMREALVRVHRDLPPTRMWTYDGEMPGPTLETRSGRGLLVEWVNELPARHFLPVDPTLHGAGADRPEVRAVVHVHGAKAPPASDGYPEDWYVPGQSALVHYPNRQDAATLWYHDHTMGIERLNQYAGLLGFFLVRDDAEDALALPRGAYEVPLVLCDRMFDADGQLHYPTSGDARAPWISEMYGDASLVNGKLRPYLEVEPRSYRFRLLNASNARIYTLFFAGAKPAATPAADAPVLHQIGSDQGLLAAPVGLTSVTLAPAERADVVVDFAPFAGQTLVLSDRAVPVLQVRVAAGPRARPSPLPATLRSVPRIAASAAVKTRILTLNEYHDPTTHRMLMLLDGKYWHEPVSEKPVLDTVEMWSFLNLTEDGHPIHLHLVRFQVLERQLFDVDELQTSGTMRWQGPPVPPVANEAGWKDTVLAAPGMATRIIARFEGYAGRYVWHCHLLEHAANEMMRPFEVVAPG
jgi:spore coat protein A, manganese oxidase